MARPIEQIAPALVLRVAPIFDFAPFDAPVIRIGEPLGDDALEILRAYQVKELAAPVLDR